jgi:hypothetical protein
VFTLTAADAQASLDAVRAGAPQGDQLAPPNAPRLPARRLRRLQQAAGGYANSSLAWSQAPALPHADAALKQQLERQMWTALRTSQHSNSPLAGMKVSHMMPAGAMADAGQLYLGGGIEGQHGM